MRVAPDPASPIDVLFCCNTAYYQHLAVAAVSLLENNQRHFIRVNIINTDIDTSAVGKLMASLRAYSNCELVIHRFDACKYEDFFVSDHVSIDTYLRVFCAEVLDSTIDKVLYLDCDIVVLGDIGDLWTIDLKGKAIGAVAEPWCQASRKGLGIPADGLYVNAGVLLINLRAWRERNVCARLIRLIREKGSELVFWDQDAINVILSGDIEPLAYKWNFSAWFCKRYVSRHWRELEKIRRNNRDISIVHFHTADKPWLFGNVVPKKRLYYHYLSKTEWRDYRSFDGKWARVPHYALNLLLYSLWIDYRSVRRRLNGHMTWPKLRTGGQNIASRLGLRNSGEANEPLTR